MLIVLIAVTGCPHEKTWHRHGDAIPWRRQDRDQATLRARWGAALAEGMRNWSRDHGHLDGRERAHCRRRGGRADEASSIAVLASNGDGDGRLLSYLFCSNRFIRSAVSWRLELLVGCRCWLVHMLVRVWRPDKLQRYVPHDACQSDGLADRMRLDRRRVPSLSQRVLQRIPPF